MLLALAGVLTVGAAALSTPRGQRWAVEKVLDAVMPLLGPDETPPKVDIGAVKLNASPLGLALERVTVVAPGPGGAEEPLCSLDALVIRPFDRTGLHWSLLILEGLWIEDAGRDMILDLLAEAPAGSAPEAEIRLERLQLKDCTLSLPASWVDDGRTHRLLLNSTEWRGLRWNGGLAWQSGRGDATLVSTSSGEATGDTTTLSWTGMDGQLQGQLNTPPVSWWPAGTAAPEWAAVLPREWAFLLHDQGGALDLDGSAPWGTVEASLSMDSAAVTLHRAAMRYSEVPPAFPVKAAGGGILALEGPVRLPWKDGENDADWPLGSLHGAPRVAWMETPGGRPGHRATVEYDLTEGRMATSGQWHGPAEAPPGTTVEWNLEGVAPALRDWARTEGSGSIRLAGPWSCAQAGDGPGSGRAEGEMTVEAMLEGGLPGRMTLQASARSMPLRLTEGLELYGQWNALGQCDLDSMTTPERWWGRLDLTDARFIPLAGFEGRSAAGPPMAMDRLHLRASGDAATFTLDIEGDFAEGHIAGPLDTRDWSGPVADMLAGGQWMPAEEAERWGGVISGSEKAHAPWEVALTSWRPDLLERLSGGQFSVGNGSRVALGQSEGRLSFDMALNSLHAGPVQVQELALSGRGGITPLSWNLTGDGIALQDVGRIEAIAARADSISAGGQQLSVTWSGALAGQLEVEHTLADGRHEWRPKDMRLTHGASEWIMEPDTGALISSTLDDISTLVVRQLSLTGDDGRITFNRPDEGLLPGALMEVRLDRIRLNPLTKPLAEATGLNLQGASGLMHGSFQCGLDPYRCTGVLQWEDAALQALPIGDLCLTAHWDGAQQFRLSQFSEEREILKAEFLGGQRAELQLLDWPLGMLGPLLARSSVDLTGSASGLLELDLQALEGRSALTGDVDISAPRISVAATGVEYGLQGTLTFDPGYIGMDQAIVRDAIGNEARLNLSVQHADFSEWNYDLSLDLASPFVALDLPADPEDLFYGRVVVSGEANVFGTADWMEVEARVESAEGTRFTMPLDALEGPELPAGIQFTGGERDLVESPGPESPFDLSLKLEILVNPNAQLSMILDQEAGERVDGRATGSLELLSNRSQSFSIQGGLAIEEGQYRFSLRDLFSKNIDIEPGGSIHWDGNPYEAELDLRAVAPMWTSPANLLPTLIDSDKTEVRVGMGIVGDLSSPRLDFTIEFPTYEQADPAMLTQVQTALSTPEEVERQSFALLATGQFIPPDQQNAQLIGLTAAAQASDLLSTRVSELLSNLSDELDIGLRYLPSSSGQASTGAPNDPLVDPIVRSEDAFEMDLGLKLLNDRLRISGTLGADGMGGFSLVQTDLRGTIDVRYALTADGRWELIGYSKPESDLEEDPRQGIGAVYQVRFDRIGDLFRGRQKEGRTP